MSNYFTAIHEPTQTIVRSRRHFNQLEETYVDADNVYIPLCGQHIMVVSHESYERIKDYCWSAFKHGNTWYAQTHYRGPDGSQHTMLSHRLIMADQLSNQTPVVDHVNGNGLDNRISNLRPVTIRLNNQNKALHRDGKLPGVSKNGKRYQAQVTLNGMRVCLGTFDTVEDAHAAYIKAVHDFMRESEALS